MAFSKKQNLFLNYLLEKIGFKKNELINKYKEKLELTHTKVYKEWRTEIMNGYSYDRYYYRFSKSECIEEVLKEIELKKNLGSIKLLDSNINSKISATDLSSFNFCPVSFSINKSFEIEYPTGEDKRIIGNNFHETLRLIDKKIPKEREESDYINWNVRENETINKIKKCELIFSGHTKENIFFENKSENYIGQPDYIFKDPNGDLFVVEEKFKFLSTYCNENDWEAQENIEKTKNIFFSNHIVQLASYLEYIKEYKLKYGILIYWFYDFNNDLPLVHSVSTKVIKVGEYINLLKKTQLNLKNIVESKEIDFLNKVNPNKCVACVVSKYCAHKTGELETLKIPYNRFDMVLKYAPFPEELKKPKENENNKDE